MSILSRTSRLAALLAVAVPALLTSCQSDKTYPVFFLTESDGIEGGAGFNVKYNGRYYTRLPLLTLRNFEKFRSFLNPDGSYGVELFIKKEYRTRLYTETQQHIGAYMLPVVNGLAFKPMKIDRAITDGELVIWNGLNGYDLKQISETVSPVDEALEKQRYSDKNPRAIPKPPKNPKQTKDMYDRTFPELFDAQS